MLENYKKTGIAILRPIQYEMLYDAIPKIENKDKLDALLYTGCRYTELQFLYKHPEMFKGHTIHMPSFKSEAKHKFRYIRLNKIGIRAVERFLDVDNNLPSHIAWNENLTRWAKKAGIDSSGISCKFSRRTWECWLVASYPDKFKQITLSQGHVERISMEFYLMLPFSDEEVDSIKSYTGGWIQ